MLNTKKTICQNNHSNEVLYSGFVTAVTPKNHRSPFQHSTLRQMLMMRWMSFIEFSRQASIGSLLATKRWIMPFTNVVGRF